MSDAPRWPGADGSPGLDFSRKDSGVSAPPAPSDLDVDITEHVPKIEDRPEFGFDRPTGPPKQRPNVDAELDSITRSAKPKPGPDYQAKFSDTGNRPTPPPGPERTYSPSPVTDAPPPPPASQSTPARAARSEETTITTAPRATRRTRKARLRLHRIDPWSVMKTSFLFSFAFGIMLVAAVSVLWSVFAGSDTMTYINDFVNSLMAGEQGGKRFNIHDYLGWQRVVGLTTVLAVIDVVIFTAVATLFAFLYNLSAVIMGGLEVTLAED